MDHLLNADKTMLVHWTYTPQEWATYMRKVVKKNRLAYFLKLLMAGFSNKAPEVWITQRQVWIGKKERINMRLHRLDEVDLCEEEMVNILFITYKKIGRKHIIKLKIPIPRGKLKEAIDVQRSLSSGY